VQVKQTERTGHRLKATYAITPAGRAEFLDLVQEGWSQEPRSFPTGLYASLAFLEHLPRETLREACDVLIERVEKTQRGWMEREAERSTLAVVPAHQRLFYENAREHLEADLRLLRALRNLAGPARVGGARG
jgi:DNA-binding PadR family transcriptional regulator